MMDITESLRVYAANPTATGFAPIFPSTLFKAAGEIERLRAELADMTEDRDLWKRSAQQLARDLESVRTQLAAAMHSHEMYQGCLLAEQENSDALEDALAECKKRENDLAEVLARVNDLLEIEASTWNVQLRIGKDLSRVLAASKGEGE